MEKKIRAAKGEGAFAYNPDGTVTHRKSVGRKTNGKRKILTVTAQTKTACIREMKKKETLWIQEKEQSLVGTKDTVTELCLKHLQYQIENDELKNKSIDRREVTVRNQIENYEIGSMQVSMVTMNDVENHILQLLREGELSESSITKALDVLNAAFAWAVLHGMLERNPVVPVKDKLSKRLKKLSNKKAEDADVMVFSTEEEKAFVEEARKTDSNGQAVYPAGDYLLLLLYTGMRCGELIGLRWNAVDLKNGLLVIDRNASMAKNRNKKSNDENNYIMIEGTTKNQKARTIELTDEALHVIKRIYLGREDKGDEDLVAPTLTGKMNTTSNMEHRLKTIMKNAGLSHIKGGCHILRKTFATNKYEDGWRVEEIAAYIGDLESTVRKYYIAIRKKMVKDGKITNVVKIPNIEKEEAG